MNNLKFINFTESLNVPSKRWSYSREADAFGSVSPENRA